MSSPSGSVNERDAMALKPARVTIGQDPDAQSWRIQGRGLSVPGWAPSLDGSAESGFRAAELLLAALGLCMTDMTMAYCKAKGFPVRRISVELEDHSALEPLRIDAIKVVMRLEGELTEEQKARIRSVATKHCKIKNTLAGNPTVDVVIENHNESASAGDETLPAGIKCAC